MIHEEKISFQTLADNEDVQIGYFDNDIMVVDSVQKFTEINAALVSMNAIAICTQGKVQGNMNGKLIELHRNQMAIIPQNIVVTDVMISPDFDIKAMFLTNRILQSFLRKKMSIWTDMMFIHRHNIVSIEEEEMLFYSHFFDMLKLAIARGEDNPFKTDIIQSLLRSAILSICGTMKLMLPASEKRHDISFSNGHFQHFLDLLHSTKEKHRSVEAYAADLCISSKYLTTICKKNSGKTANEWITEHVLEDIRYYLKQTDLSIKQICDIIGFPNSSFFGKYVKDHFGMTPLQFRRQQ